MGMRKWIYYRSMRLAVHFRTRSRATIKKIENKKIESLDPIQKSLFSICMKLVHDENSELSHDVLGQTYHIENENYLIILRHHMDRYSINLVETKSMDTINNFDVPFHTDYIKSIVDSFDREVQKRMKLRQNLKTTKVNKHLQIILENIKSKKKIPNEIN